MMMRDVLATSRAAAIYVSATPPVPPMPDPRANLLLHNKKEHFYYYSPYGSYKKGMYAHRLTLTIVPF